MQHVINMEPKRWEDTMAEDIQVGEAKQTI